MNNFDVSDFYELVPSLSPSQVSSYLESQDWVLLERQDGLLEYWSDPVSSSNPEEDASPYLLPLSRNIRKFERRFAEFLADLAEFYDCDAQGLMARITQHGWDVLLIRINEAGAGGSVGLMRATKILQAGLDMIKFAALYTSNPQRSFHGPRGEVVNSYLQRGVRLGHTEQGSFIFPILSAARCTGAQGAFGRRVMENLAAALHDVHLALEGGGPGTPHREGPPGSRWQLESALRDKIAGLADSLEFTSFDLSFRWDSQTPLGIEPPQTAMTFDFEMLSQVQADMEISMEGLRRLAVERSVPVSEVSVASEVSGYVASVGIRSGRTSGPREMPHFVAIRTALYEERSEIRIAVDEKQYRDALTALRKGFPITVVGVISGSGDERVLERGAVYSYALEAPDSTGPTGDEGKGK
ncbi:hypothetical protein ACFQ2B_39510 [Streptomyces stramineus]|uniref:Uncharacterized protein n=1 Tax=Streptomyces stramineus TaxID=173861 RepID=A0ABN0ZQH3_9ACTN